MAKTVKVKIKCEYEKLYKNKIYDAFEREDGFLIFTSPNWLLVDKNDCVIMEKDK
jgi:hypothetical protein